MKDFAYLWARTWHSGKRLLLIAALKGLFTALVTLIDIAGLGIVVDALERGLPYTQVMMRVCAFIGVHLLIQLIGELFQWRGNVAARKVSNCIALGYAKDNLHVDYHYVQDASLETLRQRSMNLDPGTFATLCGRCLQHIVQLAGVMAVTAALEGWFFSVLIGTSAIMLWLTIVNKKQECRLKDDQLESQRKLDYLYRTMTDYEYAKEVRINRADRYVTAKYNGIFYRQMHLLKRVLRAITAADACNAVLQVMQTAAMFFAFTHAVSSGKISIAQYTVLLGATAIFTGVIQAFYTNAVDIRQSCAYAKHHRAYAELMQAHSTAAQSNAPEASRAADEQAFELVFHNVSFAYPGSSHNALSNINLTMASGQRIGIVGLNGSGKTTLVKLMTRLYAPSEGIITLNGVDIRQIPYAQYSRQIAAVMQDYYLFAYSVKENITFDADCDEVRLYDAIEVSGIRQRIDAMDRGIDTSLYKELDDAGVELSGGEAQKLALARAVYKDARLLIMDEPTSAMDPFAEEELFERMNQIAGNRTAVFISHRLSGMKACEKIIVFDDGRIAEKRQPRTAVICRWPLCPAVPFAGAVLRSTGCGGGRMKRSIRKRIGDTLRLFKLIAQLEPAYLWLSLPQIALTSVLPMLTVVFPRVILDALMSHTPYTDIAKTIALYGGLLLAMYLINSLLKHQTRYCAERFVKQLKRRIGEAAMTLPIEAIETADTRAKLMMAGKATQLIDAQTLVQSICAEVIAVVTLGAIIARLDGCFLALVGAVLTVKIFTTRRNSRYYAGRRSLYAANDRDEAYLHRARNSAGGAKEIRINAAQPWFEQKMFASRERMIALQFGDFKRFSAFNTLTACVMAAQSLLVFWLLVTRYDQGIVTIAELIMFFGATMTLSAGLSAITERLERYYQLTISADDYHAILNMRATGIDGNAAPNEPSHANDDAPVEIKYDGVCFRYPGAKRDALTDVNITIGHREKLAVVGLNGAGKTTFIKLLCKFYRPTSGTITWNGTDIWHIPNERYYAMISAVFQDFANFYFELDESVSLLEAADIGLLARSVADAGLRERIASLPKGTRTCISRSFDETGVDLSGGEGQKVAIARALYKQAPLLILDEPTASLDPLAESEIYTRLFGVADRTTTIFISHRLAASTAADRIAVFCDGAIVACGHHDELMAQDGLYAAMFRKQSRAYQDDPERL